MVTRKRKLRICIFAHTFPLFEGDTTATFMGELAKGLAKNHTVTVLLPYDKNLKTKGRGYKVESFKYIYPDSWHKLGYARMLEGDRSVPLVNYLLSPFLYLFGFIALFRLVKKEKIDVISSHWTVPNGFIAAFVSFLTGVPYTTTIPGSDMYMGSKNFIFRWMVGVAVNSAKVTISDSQHYLDQLHALGFKPEKEKIIRYGVPADKFKPAVKDKKLVKSLGIKQSDKIVLAVGRMVAKKGFNYLIAAMPEVIGKNKNTKLVMIGDGLECTSLEKQVKKLGIADSVVFAGMVPFTEIATYYNTADVFVIPSVMDEDGNLDASPLVMMDAMMTGTPVVATKFAGSSDLVIDGKTGYLVKQKSSKEIARAINLLLKGDASKKLIRDIAVKSFSVKAISKKYERVFKEL